MWHDCKTKHFCKTEGENNISIIEYYIWLVCQPEMHMILQFCEVVMSVNKIEKIVSVITKWHQDMESDSMMYLYTYIKLFTYEETVKNSPFIAVED